MPIIYKKNAVTKPNVVYKSQNISKGFVTKIVKTFTRNKDCQSKTYRVATKQYYISSGPIFATIVKDMYQCNPPENSSLQNVRVLQDNPVTNSDGTISLLIPRGNWSSAPTTESVYVPNDVQQIKATVKFTS